MADRSLFSEYSDPLPNGFQFLHQYADRLGQLFTAAIWPLGSVGGTANAVTATCDPPLTAGLVEHMKFAITWAANNSGGMTLSVDGGAAVPVLLADTSAMIAGSAVAGSRALLEYVGGAFLVIGSDSEAAAAGPYFALFTASTTWTKPLGYPPDALVILEARGAGAGGGKSQSGNVALGGQGGCYTSTAMRYADVPSSVSITIGSGGPGATGFSNGSTGGTTSIGTLLTAPGGNGAGTAGSDYEGTIWRGGKTNSNAILGGAGGASVTGGTAGTAGASKFAGAGGSGGGTGGGLGTPGAGTAPSGGGGASSGLGVNNVNGGAGARGEARIWING